MLHEMIQRPLVIAAATILGCRGQTFAQQMENVGFRVSVARDGSNVIVSRERSLPSEH
jgi:hypothetical protein